MRDVDTLVREWFDGARRSGERRLPPERILAEKLGLSRGALRKGLANLEEQGLLLRHVGRGTFLREAPPSHPDPSYGPVHGIADAAARSAPRDVMAARLALEPRMARFAARDATARAFEALRAAEDLVGQSRDWPSFAAADGAFHRAIAEATGNPVMLHVFDALQAAREDVHWGRLSERPPFDLEALRVASRDHSVIVSAIAMRDADGAEAALAHHVRVEAAPVLGTVI